MAIPANPEAALDALLASRSKPVAPLVDRPLIWGVQAQADAAMVATPDAVPFETMGGVGYRFGGVALAKQVAA